MTGPLGDLCDEAALAKLLAVPEATLRQWRYMNTGPPYFKVGRHVRYSISDVTKWLEEHRKG